MRLYAFAVLLALPLLGLISVGAKADYYCCGKKEKKHDDEYRYFLVVQKTAVFDCDAHHCETKVRLRPHTKIKAKCRSYGWCQVEPGRLQNSWVPEYCLKEIGYGDDYAGKKHEDDGDEDKGYDKGYGKVYSSKPYYGKAHHGKHEDDQGEYEVEGEAYDRRPWRKY